jgi:hypothetical protein
MPLIQSNTPAAFEKNVAREIEAGKAQKQAVAIAYELQRANDGDAVEIVPESLSLASINADNRKRWAISPLANSEPELSGGR